MKYVKKRILKILHLNGISANFCCFIIGDLSPLLPEPVTYVTANSDQLGDPNISSQLAQF